MVHTEFDRAEVTPLVQQAQEGDDQALEQLCTMYWEPLTQWLYRRTGQWHDAEGLAQDTFMSAVQHVGLLRQPAAFHAWLFKIAHRKYCNYYFGSGNHPAAVLDYCLNQRRRGAVGNTNRNSQAPAARCPEEISRRSG